MTTQKKSYSGIHRSMILRYFILIFSEGRPEAVIIKKWLINIESHKTRTPEAAGRTS